MSKKTMLLAIAMASVAMFALPSLASAAEIHFEGATGVRFVGHVPANSPSVKNEPTITCETGEMEGEFTSETTGVVHGELTGCHTTLFGFTAKCHTTGSALDNTIAGEGTFHLITTSEGPAMLGTPATAQIICAGISKIETGGSLISTITKPKCGETTKVATGVASTTNGIQDHKIYTGKEYFPTARTEGGAVLETGLNAEATIEFIRALTLVCT